MIYSYNHPVTDGIYFYVKAGTNDFLMTRFSACSAGADPSPAATPMTGLGTGFDGTYNRYDAEHFHLQPVAGAHRFIANSGPTGAATLGLRLHLFSINIDTLTVTQVSWKQIHLNCRLVTSQIFQQEVRVLLLNQVFARCLVLLLSCTQEYKAL